MGDKVQLPQEGQAFSPSEELIHRHVRTLRQTLPLGLGLRLQLLRDHTEREMSRLTLVPAAGGSEPAEKLGAQGSRGAEQARGRPD